MITLDDKEELELVTALDMTIQASMRELEAVSRLRSDIISQISALQLIRDAIKGAAENEAESKKHN